MYWQGQVNRIWLRRTCEDAALDGKLAALVITCDGDETSLVCHPAVSADLAIDLLRDALRSLGAKESDERRDS